MYVFVNKDDNKVMCTLFFTFKSNKFENTIKIQK